jgi:hypothetical protein
LNRSVFPPGYAGGFKLPVIQTPRFEFEMAAVEIVKIVAGQQRYGRGWSGKSIFTEIAKKA